MSNSGWSWSCDFETNNNPDNCHVWAWGMECIETGEYIKGKGVWPFMSKVAGVKGSSFYFHNLKFDGGFILDWFLSNNYKHTTERWPGFLEFTTLISDMGQFYTIEAKLGKQRRKFIDSLKIIPQPLAKIPKMFGLEESKGEIDYNKDREIGYEPTDDEWDYLYRDVHILAEALRWMFAHKQTRLTAASNAYSDLKARIGKTEWVRYFPELNPDLDKILRKAYKGGYCIVGPQAKDGDVGAGCVFDRNSMYPTVMAYSPLPYGEPVQYSGQYEPDPVFPLYIQMLRCSFELKPGMLPTIQLKGSLGFNPVEYLKSSEDEIIDLTLTNVDLALFLEHYNVYGLEYMGGWKFKASTTLLRDFVNYWYTMKQEADEKGNDGMRTLAKLMLNSAYGKFAKRGQGYSKIPYMENGIVRYKPGDLEDMGLEYIPMGCYITAWARDNIIRLGQALYDRLLYIDTDSLHLLGVEDPPQIEQHPNKLGAWKKELVFDKARYIRAKTYLEVAGDELTVKCAGLPKAAAAQVTWDNFKPGAVYTGKLQHKTVKGGVILNGTEFKIKVDNN